MGSSSEIACPLCDADLALAGDERAGDSVVCSFCGAPFVLKRTPPREDESQGWDVDEDF